MQIFELPHRALFYKSPRPHDARIGEEISQTLPYSSIAKVKPGFVLLGHADDEGIRANHGRAGAQEGPDAIRAMFYKMTAGKDDFATLYDLGNFVPYGTLQERQQHELKCIESIFQSSHRLISLGGGHDHAYADIGAFLKSIKKQKGLVINFDAHLDLRAVIDTPNSGTAFFQLIEEFQNWDLIQIGIQPQANTSYYFNYARKNKIQVHLLLDCLGQMKRILGQISKNPAYRKRPVFLSVDMDAFSSAFAPGVSASSPIGLDPHELISALPAFFTKMNVRGMGFYEMSPKYDADNRTSKLAANLLHTYLYYS